MDDPWGWLNSRGSMEKVPNRRIELNGSDLILIGRSERCQIRFASDNTVSSVHCKIQLRNGDAWLMDNSVNGTYVGSQKIGKGRCIRLRESEDICLLKPLGGAEPPPYVFSLRLDADTMCNLSPGNTAGPPEGATEVRRVTGDDGTVALEPVTSGDTLLKARAAPPAPDVANVSGETAETADEYMARIRERAGLGPPPHRVHTTAARVADAPRDIPASRVEPAGQGGVQEELGKRQAMLTCTVNLYCSEHSGPVGQTGLSRTVARTARQRAERRFRTVFWGC